MAFTYKIINYNTLLQLIQMKIVLNTILAKQAGPGGYHVALNFFYKTLEDKENEWFYFVSKEFDEKMKGQEKGLDVKHYYVFHTQPDFRHYWADKRRIRQIEADVCPDVVYSILAPSYHTFKTVEVMRCANAWTVVGGVNDYALAVTPVKLKYRYFMKAKITQMLMRHTKYFVTQSNIAKQCILRTVHTEPENICVVSNVLPEKYLSLNTEKVAHDDFNMVYASSPAVHKDYLILPQVANLLINKFGMKNFKIHYTIPDYANELPILNELMKRYGVEDYFENHGFLNRDNLAELYSKCDLGLFPSLLETFSVTLLEYMYFKMPIVATNLDFNKEVAEDAAIYFEPHNAEDFAEKIYSVYNDRNLKLNLLKNAEVRLSKYSNNSDKFKETVNFLREVADRRK